MLADTFTVLELRQKISKHCEAKIDSLNSESLATVPNAEAVRAVATENAQ